MLVAVPAKGKNEGKKGERERERENSQIAKPTDPPKDRIPITNPDVMAIRSGRVDSCARVIRLTSDNPSAVPKITGYPQVCVDVFGVVVAMQAKNTTNITNDATVIQRVFFVAAQYMPAAVAEKIDTIMVMLYRTPTNNEFDS